MQNGKGYYSVTLCDEASTQVHTVFATSDYAAALKVRQMTGRMAQSEKDVFYLSPAQHIWTPPQHLHRVSAMQPAGT